VIKLRAVTKGFGRTLLDGVDLEIARGETVGLIGSAACGKSVILKMVCGLVEPDRGTVEVGVGRDDIGMLFQNNALFDFLTVAGNVAFPLERRGWPAGDIETRVAEAIASVGLRGSEGKMPGQLSGGMRKRAALARAVAGRPPLMLFDEPTAGLDPVTTSRIYKLLAEERDRVGATVLAVSSDVDALRAFAPRLVVLHGGRVRYDGPSDAVTQAPDAVVRELVTGAA
jgi:phospholipid/cholesterol/gamma-HCH transport system ATP-binding protein